MSDRIVALTTEDNPWNYFDDFESWHQYDLDKGYCTEEYIARIAMLNDSLPEEKQEQIREEAIDEIIKVNKGIIPYKKIESTVSTYT